MCICANKAHTDVNNRPYKVYKYTNTITGMIYIGQTCKTLEQRADKGRNYKGSRYFYSAINKYGFDAFVAEILEDGLTKEEADEREMYYISKYNSTDHNIGYNISKGGHNSIMSEETRKIISDSAKERYKDKTKNPMYGKKHTEESRAKMRKSSRHLSGEMNPCYGKKFDERRINQMSAATKKWRSEHPEDAAKMDSDAACRLRVLKPASKRVMCIETGYIWSSMTECAKEIGVAIGTLSGQITGRQKSCKGMHYKYILDEV